MIEVIRIVDEVKPIIKQEKSTEKWSRTDIDFLLECYNNNINVTDISIRLGRSPNAIRSKLCKMKYSGYIATDNTRKKWTHEENRILIDCYKKNIPTHEIARRLRRNIECIYQQASNLKVRRTHKMEVTA